MSPRRTRRRPAPEPPASGGAAPTTVEEWPDGEYAVRAVPAASGRSYTCPGCGQVFSSALPHVVAWPTEGLNAGPEHRRHWHTACWRSRDRRRPVG